MYFDSEKGYWRLAHNWLIANLLDKLFDKNMDMILLFAEDRTYLAHSGYVAYTTESIIFGIREVMVQKGISLRKLSRIMGVEPTYLCSLFRLRYTRSMEIYTLDRICKALDVPIFEVLLIAQKSVLDS